MNVEITAIIKYGEIVQCPGCKNNLFEITKDIYRDQILDASHFKGINGNTSPLNGSTYECPTCDTYWFKNIEG